MCSPLNPLLVKNSVHREGACSWRQSGPGGGVPAPMGDLVLSGGACSHKESGPEGEGACSWGFWSWGVGVPAWGVWFWEWSVGPALWGVCSRGCLIRGVVYRPPVMATAAGGTHPTGMHSY